MNKVQIIAEAGVNHNGDFGMAIALIDAAVEAGADVVKFQTFTAEQIVSVAAPKAEYQTRTTSKAESQFEMLKSLELSHKDHFKLADYAKSKNIGFLSTPFDIPSLHFLVSEMKLPIIKLPSSDITNTQLLVEAAQSHADIILSTGMSTIEEIEVALGALAFGFLNAGTPKSSNELTDAFSSTQGKHVLAKHVTLLHCTSDYPANLSDVNLRAMKTISEVFNLPVGYSDHTQGISVSIAAAALGAVVIEKHLTLDNKLPGPDHAASMEPSEFKQLVSSIREIEIALGNVEKRPTMAELQNKVTMRKGLYASRPISKGSIVSFEDLSIVRPQTVPGPEIYFSLLGSVATKDYVAGEPIGI